MTKDDELPCGMLNFGRLWAGSSAERWDSENHQPMGGIYENIRKRVGSLRTNSM